MAMPAILWRAESESKKIFQMKKNISESILMEYDKQNIFNCFVYDHAYVRAVKGHRIAKYTTKKNTMDQCKVYMKQRG